MKAKDILIDVITIGIIFLLPHLGIFPFFLYSIPILLLVWLVLKNSREAFSDIGFNFKHFTLKAILIGVPVAAVILAFMQLIFFPVLEYFVDWGYNDPGLYDFIREGKWQFFLMVILGWLIGGVYEEIVFHSFIFTRLEKMIKGKYSTQISFTIAALIFGVYHFQLGAMGLINALLVGTVYLGLFLVFKRNLWYSIICHGTYNTIVMTLIYLGYL